MNPEIKQIERIVSFTRALHLKACIGDINDAAEALRAVIEFADEALVRAQKETETNTTVTQ